jgi:ABC-type transport system involved in cytochrome c biogenesis permease subunit
MWVEGIKLFCFAASYAVALASELAGFFLAARVRRALVLIFTVAGLVAHTIYIGHRVVDAKICPLMTTYDSLLVLSWLLAIEYLWVRWFYPRFTVGIFSLPLIIGLIISAGIIGDEGRRVLHGWARVWGPVHGGLLAFGAVAVFIGFVAGVMYLVQVQRLKGKHLGGDLLNLPSLELLERINRQGVTAAFPLLTVGLALGLLLVVEERRAGVEGIRLFDPKVIFGFAVWLAFAVLLTVQARPQFRGRTVALLTIVGFSLLLFTMVGVDLLMSSWHRVATGGGS